MSLAYDAFCHRGVDPGHHVGRAKPPISGQGRGPECRERDWGSWGGSGQTVSPGTSYGQVRAR